jgi:hypothetical protein
MNHKIVKKYLTRFFARFRPIFVAMPLQRHCNTSQESVFFVSACKSRPGKIPGSSKKAANRFDRIVSDENAIHPTAQPVTKIGRQRL